MTTRERMRGPSAVVWLDGQQAIVRTTNGTGAAATQQLDRGSASETEFLAHVVHAVGDRSTVSIIGPSALRLALEREFVAISHRPDRLVGIPLRAQATQAEILIRAQGHAA